jgi:enterochelin esterase-like enzyme
VSTRLSRRALLTSAGSLAAALAACSRRDPPARAIALAATAAPPAVDAAPPRGRTQLLTWTLPERGANGEAAILMPADEGPSQRWPLVVALHGRGEALKPPPDGAMGWVRDYGLGHAISRVNNPPLGPDDVEGFVDEDRLETYNRGLAQHPYGGLVFLCPYVPDINLWNYASLADYGRYLADVLVPRARRELPVLSAVQATGIDGVSLGGAIALRTGLTRTDTFGAVGALQPAVTDDQTQEWVELAKAARARTKGKHELPLRLTTSHDDVYHDVITRLSAALRNASVAHDFADVPGPHDYPFNRGPGAIELLLWHDRVLARR